MSTQAMPSAVLHLISVSTSQATVLGKSEGGLDGSCDGEGDGGLEGELDGWGEGGFDGSRVGGGEGGCDGSRVGGGEGGCVGLCVGRFVTLLTSLGRNRCQKSASSSKMSCTFSSLFCLREALSSAFSKARAVRRRNVFASSSALASIAVAANTKRTPAERRIFILILALSSFAPTGFFCEVCNLSHTTRVCCWGISKLQSLKRCEFRCQ
jgi:hypothetical protein